MYLVCFAEVGVAAVVEDAAAVVVVVAVVEDNSRVKSQGLVNVGIPLDQSTYI
jgi:hypothetical protein